MPRREMTATESVLLIDQLNEAINRNDIAQISGLFKSFKDKCGAALAHSSCPLAFYEVENKLALKGVYMSAPFPDALHDEVDIAPAAAATAPAAHDSIVLYENPADAISGAMGLSSNLEHTQD